MNFIRYLCWALQMLTLFSLCALSPRLSAELDVLVFSDVTASHVDGETFSEKNIKPAIDFFVSGKKGPVLVLMEAYASETAQHVERIQLGINITESSRLWFGRHHNPIGYWHTEYHHGSYLQTSGSRPPLVELGGAGGLVPSHTVGGLFEMEVEQNEAAWHYAVSVGLSSRLNVSGEGHHGGGATASLHDFDIFNPRPGDHGVSSTFRIAYFPQALGESQFGAFVVHSEITMDENGEEHLDALEGDDISLDIAGVFTNYQWSDFRLIGEWYYFNSEVPHHSNNQDSSFSAAYAQFESSVSERWTPYLRFNHTFGGEKDPYLALMDGYPRKGQTVGFRIDIASSHALKFEYSHRKFEHESAGQWLMSWSAVWQ